MWDTIQIIFAVIGGLAALTAIIQFVRTLKFRMRFNWNDALRTARKLLSDINQSGWKPDIVLGIGRSGGIWGGWLAGNLGSLPFAVVDDQYVNRDGLSVEFPVGADVIQAIKKAYPDKKKMLVVEGATSTGHTPRKFVQEFSDLLSDMEIRFAVLYKSRTSTADIDYVGEEGPDPWPNRFPWHHTDLYRPYLRDLFTSKH